MLWMHAELLKDLGGLGKPPLFENDSTLLRHMDDVVDTGPDKCHRHTAIREMDNQMNQHIEMPQIQYTDKVADDSIVIQGQISPRTTETKAPEHQQDDRSGGDSRIEISTLTKDQKATHSVMSI